LGFDLAQHVAQRGAVLPGSTSQPSGKPSGVTISAIITCTQSLRGSAILADRAKTKAALAKVVTARNEAQAAAEKRAALQKQQAEFEA
jgi:hypothetical protein